MVEITKPVSDTKLAAAVATLGFIARPRAVHDDLTDTGDFTWRFGISSAFFPKVKLDRLLIWLQDGTLEKADPVHPLLDCMRALRNRERLLDLLHSGRSIALGKFVGIDRTVYTHGPTAAMPKHFGIFVTDHFRTVCALGILGIPLIRYTGTRGSYRFTTTNLTVIPGAAFNATDLMTAFNAGTLPQEHPLRYAMKALDNHTRLTAEAKGVPLKILFRKPGDPRHRSAIVDERASGVALDRAQDHLRI